MLTSITSLDLRLKLYIFRGVYGFLCGILLYFTNDYIAAALMNIFGSLYVYFLWIPMVLLYLISIPIATALGARSRYDKALRGFLVYFGSTIIVYTVISTL